MTISPVRLQLSRRAGFNLQELSRATNGLEAVNVARPGKWGNPYVVGSDVVTSEGSHEMTNAEAVQRFREYIEMGIHPNFNKEAWLSIFKNLPPTPDEIKRELGAKNLACFCPPSEPCHADVLLEIANR